ncbi:winged helix-turn-helix transcriptional regulator [Pseudonocardia lacus]|uniref:winged helix-turn-helix transcriptional regulator n=1 Tax=Pseudonocardia lacus TaxID=2835865 RepID=UPI001BDC0ED9|nr:helix-turn-helix domain-containing protein [Pseudonocardia lacus]
MALGKDYAGQDCSLARALEDVGERWTLLVLRDCFFGVRRFTDLQAHLDISRAVLTARLADLVAAGLLERREYRPGRHEYLLTEQGRALWPAVFALVQWGERFRAPNGPRRLFVHATCGATVDPTGACPGCGAHPGPEDLEIHPGPAASTRRDDAVSLVLRAPHRLLEPITPGAG